MRLATHELTLPSKLTSTARFFYGIIKLQQISSRYTNMQTIRGGETIALREIHHWQTIIGFPMVSSRALGVFSLRLLDSIRFEILSRFETIISVTLQFFIIKHIKTQYYVRTLICLWLFSFHSSSKKTYIYYSYDLNYVYTRSPLWVFRCRSVSSRERADVIDGEFKESLRLLFYWSTRVQWEDGKQTGPQASVQLRGGVFLYRGPT